MKTIAFVFLSMFLSAVSTMAQKQLILLKRESVVMRFTEGEYLRCKLKNKQKKEGKILELTATQVITSNDTLSISSIESLKLKRRKVNATKGIGGLLLASGIGYFVIGNLNALIKRGQRVTDQEAVTSLALAGTGAAFLFIRKPYKKVYRHSLRTIDYTSRFYKL